MYNGKEFCSCHVEDKVLTITINRPKRMNALHPPAWTELVNIIDTFDTDPSLLVCIVRSRMHQLLTFQITGTGRAFCAGMDLVWLEERNSKNEKVDLREHQRLTKGFGGVTMRERSGKPIIAAVNGIAFGGGGY